MLVIKVDLKDLLLMSQKKSEKGHNFMFGESYVSFFW